jgi:hypothetical protein
MHHTKGMELTYSYLVSPVFYQSLSAQHYNLPSRRRTHQYTPANLHNTTYPHTHQGRSRCRSRNPRSRRFRNYNTQLRPHLHSSCHRLSHDYCTLPRWLRLLHLD